MQLPSAVKDMRHESLEGLIARLARERDEAVGTRSAAQKMCSKLTEELRLAEAVNRELKHGIEDLRDRLVVLAEWAEGRSY